MRNLLYALLPLCGVFAFGLSVAQEVDSTVLVLDELKISDTRLDLFTIGEKIKEVPAQFVEQSEYSNLSELLMKYSGANIRSYGASGLSSASVRGTGSNHTAVFWEGINLQSPTNGGLDLTLVPMSFVDDVSLQYGGAGSLFGSGTLGGAIHLGTNKTSNVFPGIGGKFIQQIGSFSSTYSGLNVQVTQNKVTAVVRGFINYAKNDFLFYNRFTARDQEMENASIDQRGVLSETYIDINQANDFSFKYWFQDNAVHLPAPASVGGEAKAIQSDAFHRAVVNWKNKNTTGIINAQTAIIAHRLIYEDQISDPSVTNSLSWITELGTTFNFQPNLWLEAGINNTYDYAEVDGYAGAEPSRNQVALYLSAKTLLADKLEANLGVRETYCNGNFSPFMPSLGMNYMLTPDISIKSKIARSYRIPTFNDLYWNGGGSFGNPDLKPELGWSTELGLQTEKQMEKSKASVEITAFSNVISQWIQWIPVTASGWSPVNVQAIWARGIEFTTIYKYSISNFWKLQTWGDYSYTKSTKEDIAEGGNQQELHKQVIYTPIHQGKGGVDLIFKETTFSYSQIYIGDQFVTGDNLRTLEPYSISDVSLSHQLALAEKHKLTIMGHVKNLFDRDYEVRNARPMPGRNYHISIIYKFNN